MDTNYIINYAITVVTSGPYGNTSRGYESEYQEADSLGGEFGGRGQETLSKEVIFEPKYEEVSQYEDQYQKL